MRARFYFIPGYDPVGPSRYLSDFKAGLRRLGEAAGRPVRIGLRSDVVAPSWPGIGVMLAGSDAPVLDLRVADYTRLIREDWKQTPAQIIINCLKLMPQFLTRGLWFGLRLDPRVILMILIQLLAVQATWVWSLVLIALLAIALPSAGLSGPFTVTACLIAALLVGRLWWLFLERTKLLWLVRAMLFLVRLSRPGDETLDATVRQLTEELLTLEAEDPADHVVLVSHSCGLASLILVAARLQTEGDEPIRKRLTILSFGRCLPINLNQNALRASLSRLLADVRTPWLDLTSPQDLLCDALLPPHLYLGDQGTLPRHLHCLSVNYTGTPHCPSRLPGVLGLPQLLFQQFTMHNLYLHVTDEPAGGPSGGAASLPLLLWQALIQDRWPPLERLRR